VPPRHASADGAASCGHRCNGFPPPALFQSPRRSLLSPLLFCLQSSVSHKLVPLSTVLQNFGILEHSVDRRTAEAYIAVIQHNSLSRCDRSEERRVGTGCG